MSRILNRQRQLAEQGRIRLGYTTQTKGGKTYPKASHTFILTSHSREHIETAAQLWGGDVEEWQPQGNGAKQWRVITKANTIDAILPPGDPLSQAYELWNRGGCVRRCDGITEQLSGSPCPCFAQHGENWHEQRQGTVCDSKSRLKVLLTDMPGLGSWRLETGSYYATDEIAGMVDVIRGAVGEATMVPVRLRIEPRTRIAGGETKQFVVPVLELRGVTAGELVTGTYGGIKAIDASATDERAAIESTPTPARDWAALAEACTTLQEVRDLWKEASDAGALDDALKDTLGEAAQRLTPTPAPEQVAEEAQAEPDPDATWHQILKAHGERGDSTDAVREAFTIWSKGIAPEDADGFGLHDYLTHLQGGAA